MSAADFQTDWRTRAYTCEICGDSFAVLGKPLTMPRTCKQIDCRREYASRRMVANLKAKQEAGK